MRRPVPDKVPDLPDECPNISETSAPRAVARGTPSIPMGEGSIELGMNDDSSKEQEDEDSQPLLRTPSWCTRGNVVAAAVILVTGAICGMVAFSSTPAWSGPPRAFWMLVPPAPPPPPAPPRPPHPPAHPPGVLAMAQYYTLKRSWRLPQIMDDLSGAIVRVLPSDSRISILLCVNEPTRLHEYLLDLDALDKEVDEAATHMTPVRQIDLVGFDDTEGIAPMRVHYDGSWEIVVSEEFNRGLVVTTLPAMVYPSKGAVFDVVHQKIHRPATTSSDYIRVPILLGNDKKGIEGLAYDPLLDVFYAGIEKHPMRILRVTRSGDATDLFDAEASLKGLAEDIAGLHFSKARRTLMILSEDSRNIIETSLTGHVLGTMPVTGSQPEGLVFTDDGSHLFIASEPNELHMYLSTNHED